MLKGWIIFKNLKGKSKEITQNISALYVAYKREDVPVIAKTIIISAIIYALSPIDLIPDFIPVLGYLDDLIILPLLIYLAIKIIPKNIFEECRQEAKEAVIEKKWYYTIPIITVWIIIAIIIVKSIVIGE